MMRGPMMTLFPPMPKPVRATIATIFRMKPFLKRTRLASPNTARAPTTCDPACTLAVSGKNQTSQVS